MPTTYYRSTTCGSLYRVRTAAATRAQPAGTWQARRSVRCPCAGFGPEYPTTAVEVARLVKLGLFAEVPFDAPATPNDAPAPPTQPMPANHAPAHARS